MKTSPPVAASNAECSLAASKKRPPLAIESCQRDKKRTAIAFPSDECRRPGPDRPIVINKGDYLVVREVLSRYHPSSGHNTVQSRAQDLVETRETDADHRVCKLHLPYEYHYQIVIPDSIGQLQHLVRFDIGCGIETLPSSIGQLGCLQELRLGYCENELPAEIGNLVGLRILYLGCSNIQSLPASIGRLANLQELDLNSTHHLCTLPDEIEGLISLNVLNLGGSGIQSLPASIGNLKKLDALFLTCTKNLLRLPEEIGDMVSLEQLWLRGAAIASLPRTVRKLSGLKYLNLCNSKLLELQEDPEKFLWTLIHSSQSLGTLDASTKGATKKRAFALACNRARSRIGFWDTGRDCVPIAPGLWPRVLRRAKDAFREYSRDDFSRLHFHSVNPRHFKILSPSAIYQLLFDARESFLRLLINNLSTKNIPSGAAGTAADAARGGESRDLVVLRRCIDPLSSE